jgi:FkbM family methyltransferase
VEPVRPPTRVIKNCLVDLALRADGRPEHETWIRENLGIFAWRTFSLALRRAQVIRCKLEPGVFLYGRNRPGWGIRGVYIFREHVEPELAFALSIVRPGDAIIDVGSRIGTYSIPTAKRVGPSGLVIAIDPDEDALAFLRRGAEASAVSWLATLGAAAAQRFSLASLNTRVKPDARSITDSSGGVGESRLVVTVELDQFRQVLGPRPLRFLKIDAEGAESLILAGAASLIASERPVIIIEHAVRDDFAADGYVGFYVEGSRNRVLVPQTGPNSELLKSPLLVDHGLAARG